MTSSIKKVRHALKEKISRDLPSLSLALILFFFSVEDHANFNKKKMKRSHLIEIESGDENGEVEKSLSDVDVDEDDDPDLAVVRRLRNFKACIENRDPSPGFRDILASQTLDQARRAILALVPNPPQTPGTPFPLMGQGLDDLARAFLRFSEKDISNVAIDLKTPTSDMIRYEGLARLLDPGVWINDEAINGIGALIEEKLRPTVNKIAFVHSFYFSNVKNTRYEVFLDDRRRDHLVQCRYLFFPVNSNNSHWTLLVANTSEGLWYYFDSFHGSFANLGEHITERFRVLRVRVRQLFPQHRWASQAQDVKNFPWQTDGVSCGLYVMHTMECIAFALGEHEFALPSWDPKRVLLRFHYAMCILSSSGMRYLRLPDDESSSSDVLGDEFSARCASCSTHGSPLMCVPWKRSFCDSTCQSDFAALHGLRFFF